MGIPNNALPVISGLVGAVDAQTAPSYLALGTGTTAFSASDTALGAELVSGTDSGLVRATATVTRATTTQKNDTLQFVKVFTAAMRKAAAQCRCCE